MRPRRSRELAPARDFGFKATGLLSPSTLVGALPRAGGGVFETGRGVETVASSSTPGEAPAKRYFPSAAAHSSPTRPRPGALRTRGPQTRCGRWGRVALCLPQSGCARTRAERWGVGRAGGRGETPEPRGRRRGGGQKPCVAAPRKPGVEQGYGGRLGRTSWVKGWSRHGGVEAAGGGQVVSSCRPVADMRGPGLGEGGWSPAGCCGLVSRSRMSSPTERV